jgi:hypothetical protein
LFATAALVTANFLSSTITASTAWGGEITTTRTNSQGYSLTRSRSVDDGQYNRSQTLTNSEGNSVTKTRSWGDGQYNRSRTLTNSEGNSVTRTRSWTR